MLFSTALGKKYPDAEQVFSEWNKVIRLSDHHKTTGLLYYAYEKNGISLPEDHAYYLKKKKEFFAKRYAFQKTAAAEAEKLFTKNEIPHLFFKGLWTAANYAQPDMRYMLDIDILITEKFDNAVKILLDLGYGINGEDDKHTELFRAPFATIELHRSLITDRSVTTLDRYWSDIYGRLVQSENNVFRFEMTPEDEYLFMITHIILHILQDGGIGIRSLLDAELFINNKQNELDRNYIDRELEKMRCAGFEQKFTRLCENVFGSESAELTGSDLQMLKFIFSSGIKGIAKNFHAVRSAENPGRAKYYRSVFFPSYREMHGKYKWLDGKPYLLPAAWVAKAAKGAKRKNTSSLKRSNDEEIAKMISDFELERVLKNHIKKT